jgi:hypothetical protein
MKCEYCSDDLAPNGNYLFTDKGTLIHPYCDLIREHQRLRHVIITEGMKWAKHHTDPEKKKYWEDFARKADR